MSPGSHEAPFEMDRAAEPQLGPTWPEGGAMR
jgi:hypothetical protein